jgi:hypothetical protein
MDRARDVLGVERPAVKGHDQFEVVARSSYALSSSRPIVEIGSTPRVAFGCS